MPEYVWYRDDSSIEADRCQAKESESAYWTNETFGVTSRCEDAASSEAASFQQDIQHHSHETVN